MERWRKGDEGEREGGRMRGKEYRGRERGRE
jgi:hypothetical protein